MNRTLLQPLRQPVSIRGFTAVEIVLVVAVVAMILSVAIPQFIRSRNNSRATLCISNLRRIDAAKEQYLLEYRTGRAPTRMNQLVPSYIRTTPACPSGGRYTLRAAGTVPTCSIGTNRTSDTRDDHVLAR